MTAVRRRADAHQSNVILLVTTVLCLLCYQLPFIFVTAALAALFLDRADMALRLIVWMVSGAFIAYTIAQIATGWAV